MSNLAVDVNVWAEQQFSNCELGDVRRNKRLIKLAAQIAARPDGSTPDQTETWADCKAAYRLFSEEDVTFEALIEPHRQQTLAGMRSGGVWLLIGDTTEVEFGIQRKVTGLGPLGTGLGRGFMLHSSLVLNARTEDVLGLAGQEVYYRKPRPKKKENPSEKKNRSRESELWGRVIDQVGPPSNCAKFIHLFDRGADNFEVFCHLLQQHSGWVVRAAQTHRIIQTPQGKKESLQAYIDHLSPFGSYKLKLRATKDHPPRTATIAVKSGRVIMPRPKFSSAYVKSLGIRSISMWVVEAREINPPKGVEPLHWVLLTSEQAQSFLEAIDAICYYEKRPLIEEYHKALKTGCHVEERQYQTNSRLERVTAVLSVMAVRLVQLKMIARATPDRPAREVAPKRWIELLQKARNCPVNPDVTVRDFIRDLAKLGGFLGRKCDGEPGWITIWRGLEKLLLIIRGEKLNRQRSG